VNGYLWRWLIVGMVCVLGFWTSAERSVVDGAEAGLAYSTVVVAMAAVMFLGIEMQNRPLLPIHDREVDWIIGVIALVLAVSARTQLAPRLIEWFDLLRLDHLSLIIFAFGVSALLFGSRSTLHFGPAWATLILFSNPLFLTLSLLCGGGWTGTACAASVGLGIAVAVAARGSASRLRQVMLCGAAGIATAGVGVSVALLVAAAFGEDRLRGSLTGVGGLLTVVPALVGVLTALTVDAVIHRTLPRIRRREPSVPHIRTALIPLALAVAVLMLSPLPARPRTSVTADAPGVSVAAVGAPVPAGWSDTGGETYTWASDYFGKGTDFRRQHLSADEIVSDWDVDDRRRSVVVDTITSDDTTEASRFGDEGFYSSVNGRRSPKLDIDLGHGVTGRAYTVLDDTAYLTYTRLRFSWRDSGSEGSGGSGGRVHDISVIAVDDHRGTAAFPTVTDSLSGLSLRMATVLLRGGAVTEDPDADYKDLDVVTAVARGIVDARWKEGQ